VESNSDSDSSRRIDFTEVFRGGDHAVTARDGSALRQRISVMALYCAIVYPSFYLLDVVAYPEHAPGFGLIRVTVMLLGSALLVEHRHGFFTMSGQRVFAQSTAIVATAGVALMCALSEGFASNYLIGLVLCFMAIATIEIFMPLALALALTSVFIFYVGACWWLSPAHSSAEMFSALFFGLGGVFFCVVSGTLLTLQRARIEAGRKRISDQKSQLERAYSQQKEFLNTMTHELRSPLNSISGFCDLIVRKELALKPKSKMYLGRIESCSSHLLGLINDILDLAKLEAGALRIVPGPVQIRPLLEEIVEETKALVARREIDVELRAPQDLVLESDAVRIRQIMTNLASNAAKFTPDGKIMIEARSIEDGVELSVRDTGMGVDPDKQKAIFSAFVQADIPQPTASTGTGLGLSIVTRLTQRLHGSVHLESEVDRGSRFSVKLPNLKTQDQAA